MTTPSGQISLSQVNTELGFSSTAVITMNDAAVRGLAGVPSGAITMANLQNKSNTFLATISSNQTNLDLITYLTPLGYSPGGAAQITIAPGVYIYATSTGNAGLTIPSAFGPGKLTLINNGYIMGQGGNGASYLPNVAGTGGGVAMSISTPITLTNNSYVAGGGGGGGGNSPTGAQGGGGGAGGGNGGYMSTAPGGSGGGVGSSGGNGTLVSSPGPVTFRGAGGGGRILPGTGGTGASGPGTPSTGGLGGGAGGGGGIQVNRLGGPAANFNKNAGGGGGGWGAAGGAGNQVTDLGIPAAATGGPGGSSNGAGSNGVAPSPNFFPGYAGGNAINLNGNVITYPASGTIWGAVS
jgi:hypothetical protein